MKTLEQVLAAPILGVVWIVFLGGCVIDVDGIRVEDHDTHGVEVRGYFSRTVEVGTQVGLLVTASSGAVRIHGVPDGTEVVVHAVRRVIADTKRDAEEHLGLLQVSFRPGSEMFEIETGQPNHPDGRTYVVDYDITVPDYFTLGLTNGNGAVTVEGMKADVQVGNGNGDVVLEDVTGSVWASVANGRVDAGMSLPLGGEVVCTVGNGSIELAVQPAISATFTAKIGNGTISVIGLDLHDSATSAHSVEGILGAGEGVIDLSLGNGWIRVKGG